MEKTVILIPTYFRANRILKIVDNIKLSTQFPTYPLFIVDKLDAPSINICHLYKIPYLISKGNSYACAINEGFEHVDAVYYFAAADDLIFHDKWLEEIFKTHRNYRNGLVIGTNDLLNKDVLAGNHATHYLFTRGYIERYGGTFDNSSKVLYEGYDHNYTDREFIDLAKSRHVFFPSLNAIVEHDHYEKNPAKMDPTYRKTRKRIRQDRLLYEARKRKFLEKND